MIVAHTQSAGASLVIWIIAALLAWTGASSFAELGASLPLNGGAQAYLAYTYGPLVSYLFTWTTISLLSPGEFSNLTYPATHFECDLFSFASWDTRN